MIRHINHIAIVVSDLDEALSFYQDALGMKLGYVEPNEEQGVVVAFLPAGDTEVELVEPVDPNTGVARFLNKRGPGLHHICFEVDNIEATLAQLAERGVELINPQPIIGTGGRKAAFIHPRSAYGVLIELYEATPEEARRRRERVRRWGRRLRAQQRVAIAGVRAFLRGLRRKKELPAEVATGDDGATAPPS
ncbi:MAG: methylmalonyl-CoA epimerase [Chloroflexota bacterium]